MSRHWHLQRRLRQAERGVYVDSEQRPTFEDMRERLVENYAFKRNRTTASVQLNRLAEFLGGMLARTSPMGRWRSIHARADKVEPSTLRRKLAILKRMLRLSPRACPAFH